jgi:predicted Rossmann fold nucleotide-binding protein DprA/Smf involved in DNA uptake
MLTLVLSGGAIGADAMAQEWAIENTIEFQVFKPQHKDFPKNIRRFAAPHARNTLIAGHSDVIIAFWDGQSTGTKDTINKAIELSKKVYIFEINTINL